jgi:hypothetical protein
LAIDPKHTFSKMMLSIALEEQLDQHLSLDTFLDDLSFEENEAAADPMLVSPPTHKPYAGSRLQTPALSEQPLPLFSSPLVGTGTLPQDPDLSAMDDSTMSMDDSR